MGTWLGFSPYMLYKSIAVSIWRVHGGYMGRHSRFVLVEELYDSYSYLNKIPEK